MCTAITLQDAENKVFFGRTMDFSYPLEPEVYYVPCGYQWNNLLNTHHFRTEYSFVGVGQDISPVTFADGVNERGFAAAALYFPGFAQYPSAAQGTKIPIAAIEMLRLLLGFCDSVKRAVSVLEEIEIVGVEDRITHSVAPLHWMVADVSGGCAVIEKTAAGLQIFNNPLGVLSNSPDFSWQITNLRNYMNLTPIQKNEAMWGEVELRPFGQGGGTWGLPGDCTPPGRFVRAAYHKNQACALQNREEAVLSGFHVLETVSVPKGLVFRGRRNPHKTKENLRVCRRWHYDRTSNRNHRIVRAFEP